MQEFKGEGERVRDVGKTAADLQRLEGEKEGGVRVGVVHLKEGSGRAERGRRGRVG